METKDFLDKAKDEAGNILSNVAQKTEEIAKKSKLKIKISAHKVNIMGHLKKIGKYVHEHKDDYKENEFISEQLEQIEQLEAKISKVKEQLQELVKEKKNKS